MRPPLAWAGLIAACAFLPLLWLGPVLFGGQVLLPIPLLSQIAPWGAPLPGTAWNPLMWDAAAFFYPVRLAAAQAVRGGHLPLWNPYLLCGTPLLADVQSAVLYPPNLVFWVIPVERAFGVGAYLHLVLAGLFTVYWLRQEGLSRTAALLGAITFAFGGWSIAWLELPNFLATATWAPLMLGLMAGAARRPWGRTAAGCAIASGLMLTAGHVQVAFYCLLGVLLYTLYRGIADRRRAPLGALLAGIVLGAMLAAPQLLPARALSAVSHRSSAATAAGYNAFAQMGLPLAHLAGFIAPDLFGNPSHGLYLGLPRAEYSEVTAYVGLLPLLLAIHALFGARRSRSVGALAIMAGVGLLLALGTPLNAPLYFGVPGFARFGSPGRALVLAALALSGLAGFGWDLLCQGFRQEGATGSSADAGPGSGSSRSDPPDLRSGPLALEAWNRTVAGGAAVALLLVACGIVLYPARLRADMLLLTGAPALVRAALLFVLAVLLPSLGRHYLRWMAPAALALLLLDLWSFGAGYNLTGPAAALRPPERFVRDVQAAMGASGTASGPGPFASGRVLVLNASWPLRTPPRAVLPPDLPAVMGLLDVGGYEGAYFLSYKQLLNGWEGGDASPPTNGNMVTPHALASPLLRELAVRAVISPALLPPGLVERAGLRYVDGDAGWHVYGVLHPSSRAEVFAHWPPGPGEIGVPVAIDAAQSTPDRIVLPAGRPGYLLLRDTMAAGWEARIDGKPGVPVPSPSPVQRVVHITPQDRRVVWEYRPPSLAQAWPVAGLGFAGTVLLGLAGMRPRRRRACVGT